MRGGPYACGVLRIAREFARWQDTKNGTPGRIDNHPGLPEMFFPYGSTAIGSPTAASPPEIILANMPSLGITQSPTSGNIRHLLCLYSVCFRLPAYGRWTKSGEEKCRCPL